MSTIRFAVRAIRPAMAFSRPITTTACRMSSPGKSVPHPNVEEHRKIQMEKPLNPHMTNTNSTNANEMPSVGADKAPPELITSLTGEEVTPTDSSPENTERMTGGTQKGKAGSGDNADLGVGEMEGGQFKVEPLRRTGEDANTMRARLLYQCRKRGTLESDLLMSTFAESHLRNMSMAQMTQLDLFLDENDWDIYYWATQTPSPTSRETAEGAGPGPEGATPNARGTESSPPVASGIDPGKQTGPELQTDEWRQGKARSGEWAQTVGTFKPAHRPVPARWKNSEVLAMLRKHVLSRSAGGIHEGAENVTGPDTDSGARGTGMAFMPPVFQTDQPEKSS